MTTKQLLAMSTRLDCLRDGIMSKEMGDEGWDLRDEVLLLAEIVQAVLHEVTTNEETP